MHYDLTGGFTGFVRVRYSPYGVPEPVLAGDLNHDGVLNDDDRADLALTRASGQTTGVVTMGEPAWNPDADLNFDGVIDEDDALALTNLVNKGGESEPGELWDAKAADFLRGLTIGYAGMMHDPQLGAWLMRNRWHDPALGRFISRDPAGYVDGMSLYAYVSGNPLKYWDPFGLAECSADFFQDQRIKRLLRGEITKEQFREEELAAAAGALLGVPGPEDLLFAGALRFIGKGLARLGRSVRQTARAAPDAKPRTNSGSTSNGPTKTVDGGPEAVPTPTAGTRATRTGAIGASDTGLPDVTLPPITRPVSQGTGGRLGSQRTREHVAQVAAELESRGWSVTGGGGRFKEEYLPGPGGGRLGSNWVDITAVRGGRTLRVNTIDTLADGLSPTAREAAAAASIRAKTRGAHLLLVPKPK